MVSCSDDGPCHPSIFAQVRQRNFARAPHTKSLWSYQKRPSYCRARFTNPTAGETLMIILMEAPPGHPQRM